MLLCLIVLCAIAHAEKLDKLPPSCESPIYCHGDILHHVQLARVFKDGKTFVDLRMKHSQSRVLENFDDLQKLTGSSPGKSDLTNFVKENFEPGNELIEWEIHDYNENPRFLHGIKNTTIQKFARDIIKIWPSLGRKVRQEVFDNQESYSFIPVPNGFIVPGGRFQEYYYWDSYWIIDGLLINEMYDTARGMIENFVSLVDRIGFVPNGGRIYYLRRSQPPLLTPMAFLYYEATSDTKWVRENIEKLSQELTYWEGQSVDVQKHRRAYHLYHYYAVSEGPRPESYREDYNTARFYNDEDKQREVYIDIKSGAESGWDFSNRWVFDSEGGNLGNLSSIETRRVAPVDLNSFLCMSFRQISQMYAAIGDHDNSREWRNKYHKLRGAIAAVLWDPKDRTWHDYDLKLQKHRRYFYPSNLAPLWAQCVHEEDAPTLGESVLSYLKQTKALEYPGGIPTSLDHTGEQWDFPNAWAPLQDLIVRGLHNSNNPVAQEVAEALAKRWVNVNLIGYQNTEEIFEKYDAVVPGRYGGGGEYEVQPGFGFTNGVALRFIHDYYGSTFED